MPDQKEPSLTSNNDKGSDLMGSCIEFFQGIKLDPATEVPEFVPSRHELFELLRFWYRIKLEIEFRFFNYGVRNTSDWRELDYCKDRMNHISYILYHPKGKYDARADDDVDEAYNKVVAEFRKGISDADWENFRSGPHEEWRFHQEKMWRSLETETEPENKK